MELQDLLHADHGELERVVWDLLDTGELEAALDNLQLKFAAHIEAESAVLQSVIASKPPPELATVLSLVLADHVEQERAIVGLLCAEVGTDAWRARILELQVMLQFHDRHEREYALPALRGHLQPASYRTLATAYQTERMEARNTTRAPLSLHLSGPQRQQTA
ncbi:MAG TPA: hypothetical protein VIU61_24010 [Kofleriaceae bacterium]